MTRVHSQIPTTMPVAAKARRLETTQAMWFRQWGNVSGENQTPQVRECEFSGPL